MKKKPIKLLLTTLLLFFCLSTSVMAAPENLQQVSGTLFYTEDGTLTKTEQQVLSYFGMLPEYVLNLLLKYHAKVYFPLNAWELTPHAGAISYGSAFEYERDTGKVINIKTDPYIDYFIDKPSSKYPDMILREAGHLFDWLSVYELGYTGSPDKFSSTAAWANIWIAEKEFMITKDPLAKRNAGCKPHRRVC